MNDGNRPDVPTGWILFFLLMGALLVAYVAKTGIVIPFK